MKIVGLSFIVLLLLGILRYTKLFQIKNAWILGATCVFVVSIYLQIHFKNKDRNTPRPVYIAN